MVKNSTAFVGLDLEDKRSNLYVLDPEGELIEEIRIPTTEPAFRRKFASLPPCRGAMEAGTHSRWASRLLEQLGHDVLVANPRRLRLTYENSPKADEADAEHLARLARLDPQLLDPIRQQVARVFHRPAAQDGVWAMSLRRQRRYSLKTSRQRCYIEWGRVRQGRKRLSVQAVRQASLEPPLPRRLRQWNLRLGTKQEEDMTTIKVIELIGTSRQSWEDAASNAIKDAHQTVSGITGLEVVGQTARVENGVIAEYRANLKVAFLVEEGR